MMRELITSRMIVLGSHGEFAQASVVLTTGTPENQTLLPFLDLAAAVDNEGDVLAVFRRLDGGTFGRGFDVPDLRIARRLKLGYKLLLG